MIRMSCRPSIAPTAPEPRTAVPAHAPEALRACWVESGRMAGFTASTVVVQPPEGTLLIDGGNSSRFREEIEVYDRPERRWTVGRRELEPLRDPGVRLIDRRLRIETPATGDQEEYSRGGEETDERSSSSSAGMFCRGGGASAMGFRHERTFQRGQRDCPPGLMEHRHGRARRPEDKPGVGEGLDEKGGVEDRERNRSGSFGGPSIEGCVRRGRRVDRGDRGGVGRDECRGEREEPLERRGA